MSLGFTGFCRKEAEDDVLVIYSYAGENWNDKGKSKHGDRLLCDGCFLIYKDCLEEPEIHVKLKRMPSGRKKLIEKRILRSPDIYTHLSNHKIIIEKECKNAFRHTYGPPIDYIAYRLILRIFKRYQLDGKLPEQESFLQ